VTDRDPRVLAVFLAVVLAGGLNGVAIRFSNQELAPFWGSVARLLPAAVLMFGIVLARRSSVPRGQALVGIVLFGVLGFAVSYALLYWGLVDAPAGAGAVAIALVPLLTLLLAPIHGLERFRWQALAGALISLGGVVVVFADQLGADVSIISLVALLGGAAAVAESTILVKRFPQSPPEVTNTVAMAVAVPLLLGLSIASGERQALPTQPATIAALVYLVTFGSVFLFMGFLYVLARWPASAASYEMLLMPLVTVPAAGLLRSEPVTAAFVVGAAFVLMGVYVGAIAPPITLPGRRAPQPVSLFAQPAGDVTGAADGVFVPPNCP
jgi:drug/metabolite transporter (DMT)-like permease